MTIAPAASDQPYADTTAYGNGPNDSITDTTESAAITHHTAVLGGQEIAYTATAGHLVTVDPHSSKPTAKIFYVAFTKDTSQATDRPVTFFYNGGPGSSSVFLLLGSFAPMRLKTNMPHFTPPAPYTLEPNPAAVQTLSDYTGIPPVVLTSWEGLNVADADSRGTLHFLTALMRAQGKVLGAYDGRVLGINTGIAGALDPLSGGNDATMNAVAGAYTAMWNSYLEDGLKFTSTSSFTDLNDQAFENWDFGHIDPTGAQKGKDVDGNIVLYTAGDLAATMALNVDLKVLSANGYFDSMTLFSQTVTDLQNMPLADPTVRENLTIKYYPSGHMVYLDGDSRTALKADLADLYDSTISDRGAVQRIRALQLARLNTA